MVDKISHARKKELEQPDPFLESIHNGINKAVKYKKQLIWISCAVVAVIVIFTGTVYSIRTAGNNASALLTDALERYSDKDPVKGYDAVKDDFKTIMDEYSNTAAGRVAMIRFAEICYKASKLDQAYEMYQTALDEFSSDPVMNNLLLASLGHTCQAQKRYKEALKYFKKIVKGKSSFLKDEALFNMGILFAHTGDEKESEKVFKQIVSDHGASLYLPMAENRLAGN
ncbi:MAG: tetratricopeptide repeat protein [Thermodesulfobacteriota bacterium]|nr:tetratricopeptide repeat protein [Thermodesulfobacteriota bacterium]